MRLVPSFPGRVPGAMLVALALLAALFGWSLSPVTQRLLLASVAVLVVWMQVSRTQQDVARGALLVRERSARSAADEANRAKDDFFSTISHELRGPLNAILGWVFLLRSGRLDEVRAAHGLETIERNARSQARLIADLLDVSRIIGGQLRLEKAEVDLGEIIDQAADSVRPAADDRHIHLQTHLPPARVTVAGDRSRLQQVMENLYSNAIKFTPQGGRVDVRLAADDAQVRISMSDSGQGIRSEFLPYVFDRFRQANGTPARYGGLGLGLAIVRHLVELHGGMIEAASPGEGLGATFAVTLPFAQADASDGPVMRSGRHSAAAIGTG